MKNHAHRVGSTQPAAHIDQYYNHFVIVITESRIMTTTKLPSLQLKALISVTR